MKYKTVLLALIAIPFAASAFPRGYHAPRAVTYTSTRSTYNAPVRTRGYLKRNGTYVAPHYSTAPNRTKSDNWTSKPNVNPYTGKAGTKDPSGH